VLTAFCCAAALVLWPDRDALRRGRVLAVTGRVPLSAPVSLRAIPLPSAVAAQLARVQGWIREKIE